MNCFERNTILIKLFDQPKKDVWNNCEIDLYFKVAALEYGRPLANPGAMTRAGLNIKVPLEEIRRELGLAICFDLI